VLVLATGGPCRFRKMGATRVLCLWTWARRFRACASPSRCRGLVPLTATPQTPWVFANCSPGVFARRHRRSCAGASFARTFCSRTRGTLGAGPILQILVLTGRPGGHDSCSTWPPGQERETPFCSRRQARPSQGPKQRPVLAEILPRAPSRMPLAEAMPAVRAAGQYPGPHPWRPLRRASNAGGGSSQRARRAMQGRGDASAGSTTRDLSIQDDGSAGCPRTLRHSAESGLTSRVGWVVIISSGHGSSGMVRRAGDFRRAAPIRSPRRRAPKPALTGDLKAPGDRRGVSN